MHRKKQVALVVTYYYSCGCCCCCWHAQQANSADIHSHGFRNTNTSATLLHCIEVHRHRSGLVQRVVYALRPFMATTTGVENLLKGSCCFICTRREVYRVQWVFRTIKHLLGVNKWGKLNK